MKRKETIADLKAEAARWKKKYEDLNAEIERVKKKYTPAIERALDAKEERDPSYDEDRYASRDAFNLDEPVQKQAKKPYHEGVINGHVVRMEYGAHGCCLTEYYRRVRDHGPMKEGEQLPCLEGCRKGPHSFASTWIMKGGILHMADRDEKNARAAKLREEMAARARAGKNGGPSHDA